MIDRCFKCEGHGTILVFDEGCTILKLASPIYYKNAPCPRCLGSGALDYRVVEARPVTASQCPPEETL